MIRQKSFQNQKSTLYLVPTPIGNMAEVSPRQVETLKKVDVIACEDTRNSGQLLKTLGIHKRLIAYQNFNEESSSKGILSLLEEGKNVALISDAGYPLLSDPGQKVVRLVSQAGYNVVSISGSSAILNALVASGLVVQPFLFVGFLGNQTSQRKKRLKELKDYPMTMVFYEAPHRLKKCLKDCLEILGDRSCTLARELTKLHEEYLRGTFSEILGVCQELKGEMVLVVEGKKESNDVNMSQVALEIQRLVNQGLRTKDASKQIAEKMGLSKNKVYNLYLETLPKD
ncbi:MULTISPECIES: 16S rRNA (cytidine(1402)-2'-O)-methyltransferase [Terrabacteria group]|uniref:16S rRNA (cytidine(1402)-2'-O)-methyltransferase n=1 Tax=Bacillati TaxID=1783272 RepID=UPI001C6E8E5D|nr:MULTISPECIES: 16S rRNA (cytidine(1402)-2'-O)-methyltransferase [Terrabacteria group]MBW9212527.1 16S rRNA (cytidine(1402)-2'-O)-methyltransferase [Trueperella sp. zg.1013]